MAHTRNQGRTVAPVPDASDDSTSGAATKSTNRGHAKREGRSKRRQREVPGRSAPTQDEDVPDAIDVPVASTAVQSRGPGSKHRRSRKFALASSEDAMKKRWEDYDRFDTNSFARVLEVYDELMHDVSRWKTTALPLNLAWDSVSRSEQKRLLEWAPKAKEHLDPEETNWDQAFMRGWVWRVLWDELFSPEAGDHKWKGQAWKALARFQDLQRQSIKNEPQDSRPAEWYRYGRHTAARLAYRQHGDHVDPERLKKRILSRFRGCLRECDEYGLRDAAEEALSRLVQHAILIDFCKHFATYPIVLQWSDPFTGMANGFPVRQRYDNGFDAMEADWASWKVALPGKSCEGHEVVAVLQPTLRVYGQAIPHRGHPPTIVHLRMYNARPLVVLVYPNPTLANPDADNERQDGDGGGGGGEGECVQGGLSAKN